MVQIIGSSEAAAAQRGGAEAAGQNQHLDQQDLQGRARLLRRPHQTGTGKIGDIKKSLFCACQMLRVRNSMLVWSPQ